MITAQVILVDAFCLAAVLFLPVIPPLILFSAAGIIRSSLGMVLQSRDKNRKWTFWRDVLLGALGGLAAETAAIATFFPALSRWCWDSSVRGSYCNGFEVFALLFIVPFCAIFGSSVSMLWTWYSRRMPANNVWASVFTYSGRHRALNLALAIVVQAVYWALFALAVYFYVAKSLPWSTHPQQPCVP